MPNPTINLLTPYSKPACTWIAEHISDDAIWFGSSLVIEHHGLHAFRRFLGTTLNEKGVDLETIKDVLRHSNNDVTKKSYIKPSTKRFRKMLEMVEKDFNRALKQVRRQR